MNLMEIFIDTEKKANLFKFILSYKIIVGPICYFHFK